MTDVTIIFVTAGSEDEAMTIGRKLVEERLVACVSVIPRIRSIYWWKDEICNADEYLMVMKTRSTLFPSIQARVRELHSYEVPEIIGLRVENGLPDYLSWVLGNTGLDL